MLSCFKKSEKTYTLTLTSRVIGAKMSVVTRTLPVGGKVEEVDVIGGDAGDGTSGSRARYRAS
jgi:hypothetical protein